MKRLLSVFAMIVMASSTAFGQSIVTPTSITYTNSPNQEETGIPGLADENNIINGSGISGPITIANFLSLAHAAVDLTAPGNAWATVDIGPGAGDFFAEGGNAPVFDMGISNESNIDSLIVWDYHFGGNNGNHPSLINLEFSSNGGTSFFDSRLGLAIPLTSGTPGLPSQAFFAPVSNSVNFIRMTVADNHFGGAAGGDRVGVAEVRFSTSAVPEPSSASILLAGLVGLAGFRRRG